MKLYVIMQLVPNTSKENRDTKLMINANENTGANRL